MSFSHVWRDYNTQRERRYRDIPKILKLSRAYVSDHQDEMYEIVELLERAKQLKALGLALLGEQFEAEKKLSKAVRGFIAHCHHHHALLIKNAYMDLEHELLDADAHLHALHSLLIGKHKLRV